MDNGLRIPGLNIDDILFNLKKLDTILGLEHIQLEICLIGGTACLLTGITDRSTVDYDLLNLDYSPSVRSYLNFFHPYDLVDFEATTIPHSYKERLKSIYKGTYLSCFIPSIEDIILSKLCRNLEKDFKDIDKLIVNADINKVIAYIKEVKSNIFTRYPRIRENFRVSLDTFSKRYGIDVA